MRRIRLWWLLAGICFFWSGCALDQPSLSPPATSPLISPVADSASAPQLPTPKLGLASLSGVLYTSSANAPIPQTAFQLIPLPEGVDESVPTLISDQSGIPGMTGTKGEFFLTDVPPGTYRLAVWSPPYAYVFAVESLTSTARLNITLRANEHVQLGIVYAPWP